MSQSLARVLRNCREPKLSARILLNCAASLDDAESKVAIGTAAFELDRHSHDVLIFLRAQLEHNGEGHGALFADVTNQLCTALADAGDFEAALRFHADLEEMQPDDPSLLTRKARLLQAADRREDALRVLEEARASIEASGDKARVIQLYEQILKLDGQAKDIKKALRELRDGKARTRRRRLRMLLSATASVSLIWFGWSWYDHHQRMATVTAKVRSLLTAQDVDGARQALAAAQLDMGGGDKWQQLRVEILDLVFLQRLLLLRLPH